MNVRFEDTEITVVGPANTTDSIIPLVRNGSTSPGRTTVPFESSHNRSNVRSPTNTVNNGRGRRRSAHRREPACRRVCATHAAAKPPAARPHPRTVTRRPNQDLRADHPAHRRPASPSSARTSPHPDGPTARTRRPGVAHTARTRIAARASWPASRDRDDRATTARRAPQRRRAARDGPDAHDAVPFAPNPPIRS